ncbi:MAG: 23S rRNA (adenine(2503)-C(2))-methyltransferase RlmN [Clostridia bacterium]|nr:23S rRNA (adenine(2503)-C(2))-methyltransferase RlmN [Clostridia bacterium]
MDKIDICSLYLSELAQAFKEDGIPAFRAKQVYGWIIKGAGFDGMKNISADMKKQLAQKYTAADNVRIQETFISKKDGTKKFLFALGDGNIVEGVLMKYNYGNTLCISSQVGCKMGCAFCASTLGGCVRNLTAGEMHNMLILANALDADKEHRGVTNIVIMGSGEPMDNYDNVVKFLRLASSPDGLNISPRNISLSTCGVVPGIFKLMEEDLPITLAISLHAPTDDIRNQIMPVNRAFPLKELLPACAKYIERTKRRLVFEYALIGNMNSSVEHAKQLHKLVKGLMCHINLIPLNEVEESPLKPAKPNEVEAFIKTLEKLGVSATIRREMGSDIQGACGQLRRKYLGEDKR